jgi:hypothetical protein
VLAVLKSILFLSCLGIAKVRANLRAVLSEEKHVHINEIYINCLQNETYIMNVEKLRNQSCWRLHRLQWQWGTDLETIDMEADIFSPVESDLDHGCLNTDTGFESHLRCGYVSKFCVFVLWQADHLIWWILPNVKQDCEDALFAEHRSSTGVLYAINWCIMYLNV